jgi:hypothetical protein
MNLSDSCTDPRLPLLFSGMMHAARRGCFLAAGLVAATLSTPALGAQSEPVSSPERTLGAGPAPLEISRGSSSARLPADLPLKRESSQAPAGSRAATPFVLAATLLVFGGAALLRRYSRAAKGQPATDRSLAAWLRRFSPSAQEHSLRVLQSARLTARASVHVLKWDGREWLIGCTEQGVTVMGQRISAASQATGGAGIAGDGGPRRQRSPGLDAVSEGEK